MNNHKFIIMCLLALITVIGIYEYLYKVIEFNKNKVDRKYMIKTNFLNFINFILIKIPLYFYQFIISLFTIICLPINILRIVTKEFDYHSLKDKYVPAFNKKVLKFLKWIKINYNSIITKVKSYFKEKNKTKKLLQDQLDIYYDCISTFIQVDNAKNKAGLWEYIIGASIIALQFGISFATTLSGANLIFASVSNYAPIVFTFVVQTLIVIFSNKAFKKNKKSKIIKCGLWLTVIISIFFSYTGIVVGQESPVSVYRASYEVYEARFDDLKTNLLDEINEEKQKNLLEGLLIDLGIYYGNIYSTRDILQQSLNGINLPNTYTYTYIDPQTGQERQGFNQGLFDAIQQANADRAATESRINVLDRYIAEFDKIYDIEENGSVSSIPESEIESYYNYISKKTEENNDNRKINTSTLTNLIEYSNTYKTTYNLDELPTIDASTINQIEGNIETYQNISSIELSNSEELFGNGKIENSVNNNTTLENHLYLFGIGLNEDMTNLASIRTKMQDEAEVSYEKIKLYAIDDKYKNQLEKLEESKDDVLKQPNLFSYSLQVFRQDVAHAPDYFIMLIMAILVDAGSAFLGFVKQRRKESFIYVKTSKDYYEEYDDIFEIIFMSIMRNYEVKVRKGNFIGINLDDFQNNCMKYVANTAQLIREFLEEFEISEGTYVRGFNLKCKLDKQKLKKYNPLISVLLKTNLLKIISYEQYNRLMKDTFPKMEISDSRENGEFYLILRNKGENYLRENIPFQYAFKQNDE